MEQHAIPQQISNYEFKLVGEMTLKQFLKAAVGIVLAFVINASHLIFFIKWPLMLISGGGGLMLAFVPFQDRPLEVFIIAFLRSVYSPTIYTYKKQPDKDWMNLLMSKSAKSVGKKNDPDSDDNEEAIPIKDDSKVKEFIESLPSVRAIDKSNQVEEVAVVKKPKEMVKEAPKVEVKKEEAKEEEVVLKEDDWRDQKANLNLKTEKLGATAKATFGAIPMPDKPETPNMVVGMVTDLEGKIIEGAIVEIQDEKGNPSRVLKTNPLGQFKTTTPLADGKYLVITEKEHYNFDRVDIKLSGEIVEPIKIQAII